jgi:hypothetical protein
VRLLVAVGGQSASLMKTMAAPTGLGGNDCGGHWKAIGSTV